jgi:hypothetical protein
MDLHTFAHVAAKITVWHASAADGTKCYDCPAVMAGTGLTMRQLHGPLLLLGWDRRQRWGLQDGRRVLRVWWAPPGHKVPQGYRGRPRFNLEALIPINYL